ncbi:hypothetical protein M0804_002767 [Polistes exclamans]|nr:hypothetical protein M0804_002767 [Polistes exclamans]
MRDQTTATTTTTTTKTTKTKMKTAEDPSIKLQSVLETKIFATIEIEERSHVVRRPCLKVYYTSNDVVSVSSHVSAESAVGFRGSWRKIEHCRYYLQKIGMTGHTLPLGCRALPLLRGFKLGTRDSRRESNSHNGGRPVQKIFYRSWVEYHGVPHNRFA